MDLKLTEAAVIIGNMPALAMLVNAFRSKSKPYSGGAYQAHIGSKSNAQSGFHLGTLVSVKAKDNGRDWDGHSSQEDLAGNCDGIMVTTTIAAAKGPCDGSGKESKCEFR